MTQTTAELALKSERFNRSVRATCCDACNYPECGCTASADILRRGLTAWFDAASPGSGPEMKWERADEAGIDPGAHYLVKTNGGEWRDFDLALLSGWQVQRYMEPDYVRGRPEWIARINAPALIRG